MKLLLTLLFLPLNFFMHSTPAPDSMKEGYSFEVTVESLMQEPVLFNLSVTGATLAANGSQEPFELKKKNLKTPFQLHLDDGKYTVTVTSKAKKGAIISKVQGMKGGVRMGSASGESGYTILNFGFGGFFSARDE